MQKIVLFLFLLSSTCFVQAIDECSGKTFWHMNKKGAGALAKAWNRTFFLKKTELIWCGNKGKKGFHKLGALEYKIIKDFAIETGIQKGLKFADIPLDPIHRGRKTLHLSQCSDETNCSDASAFDEFVTKLKRKVKQKYRMCKLRPLILKIHSTGFQILHKETDQRKSFEHLTSSRPVSEKECFLRGAWIFEDTDRKLFDLSSSPFCLVEKRIASLTHREVMKRQRGVEAWNREEGKYQKKLRQYDLLISPAFKNACHPICRKKKKEKKTADDTDVCKDEYEDPKEVALIYHYKYKDKGYTFLKLESYPSSNFVPHLREYINRVIGRSPKIGLPDRREDCGKKCTLYNPKTGEYNKALGDRHIPRLIIALQNKDRQKVNASVKYYNKTLRTGDEIFIPQKITDQLLSVLK